MLVKSKKDPEVVFWLQSKDRNSGKATYMFQIEGSRAAIRKVAKQLKGHTAGEGFNPQDKTEILIIKRSFESTKAFATFRKKLNFVLKENKN